MLLNNRVEIIYKMLVIVCMMFSLSVCLNNENALVTLVSK